MRKTRLLLLTAIAGLGLTLSACNEAALPLSSEYPNGVSSEDLASAIETAWVDYTVPATSVVFPDADKVVNINQNQTHQYAPEIAPKSATIQALTFTSQNLNVATVSATGLLTAVGGGSTTVVVSSKENSFTPITLEVNVTVPVTEINVSATDLDLGYGYQEQLNVSYVPADTTQTGVTFEVVDPSVANVVTVSEDGLVTAGNVDGTAKVRVASPFLPNGAKEVNVVVVDKVVHVASVEIINGQSTVEIDKQFSINATISPADAEDKGIIYASSNEEVATIDASGKVLALKEGTTTISATAHENSAKKDEFALTVYAVKADAIDVPAAVNLVLNATEQLHPTYKKAGETVTPSRGALTYESDAPTVAVVSKDGLISAKSVGTANITVKDTTDPLSPLEATVVVTVSIDVATYSITGFADWTPNDGAKVFAWCWGGDAVIPGAWYDVTLSYRDDGPNDYADVTGTFDAPRNINGFVLVRCANGTTTPDWEITDDEAGRIYNKTADYVALGTEYTALEWTEYPEPEQLEGFGIRFSAGVSVLGEDAGYDNQGRQQYEMKNIHFFTGSTFQIYDFSNKAGWVENIEGWSFGGDSATSEAWKSYLEIDGDEYKVLADFTADIFLKIAFEDNSIYFGLVDTPVTGESYAVKIGDVTTNLVEGTPTGTEKQLFHAANVKVTAGESVTFFADYAAITAHIGPDADDLTVGSEKYNNYKGSVASILTIQADKADADIWLRIYDDGMSFWISGGDSADHDIALPATGFGLFFENGATVVASDEGETTLSEVTYHQYLVSNQSFVAGEQFKLYDFEHTAGWVDNVDGWSFGGDSAEAEAWKDYLTKGSEYYSVKQNFYADVWMKLSPSGNIIYFGLKAEPIPAAASYKVRLGAVDVALAEQVLSEEEIAAGKVARYSVEQDVVADTEFLFLADDVTIREHIGPNADDIQEAPATSYYNNWKEVETLTGVGLAIQADKDDANIELNVYEDGYSFWISGGDSADHALPEKYYLIGGFNGWTTEDPTYKLTKVSAINYKIEGVTLLDGQTLKIFWPNGEDEVAKYITCATTYDGCHYTLDGDGNLVIDLDGVYTVNLWLDSAEGNYIQLTKTADAVVAYTATVNDVVYNLVLDPDADTTGDYADRTALYKAAIPEVEANQVVEIKKNGVAIAHFALDGGNNNIFENAGVYKVKDSKDSAVTLYLNIWAANGAGEVWATAFLEGAAPLAHPYYILGLGDWEIHDAYNLEADDGDANHYALSGVELHAGDKFKAYNKDSDTWFGNASDGEGYTIDGDGNVVVSADGVYTINFYVTSPYGNHIGLVKEGELTTLQISKNVSTIKVGASDDTVTASNVTGTLAAVSSDTDVATVAVEGTTITIHAVAEGTATVTVSDDGAVTRTISVTIKPAAVKTKIYLDVTAITWWENDEAATYVYAYKGDDKAAAWPGIKMTRESAGLYSAEIEDIANYDYFIFCRTSADGTVVHNRTSKDGGTAINKSDDWSTKVVWKINGASAIDYDDGNYTGSWTTVA